MTSLSSLIARTRVSDAILALDPLITIQNGRCPATYRGGTDPRSVSIDDANGLIFDNGTNKGGGVLTTIEWWGHMDRREAVEWLQSFHGETLEPLTGQAVARRRQAHQAARELLEWRDRLTQYLRAISNRIRWECRCLEFWSDEQADFSENALWELVAAVPDRRRTADGLDDYITHLRGLTAPDLYALRRRLEAASAA